MPLGNRMLHAVSAGMLFWTCVFADATESKVGGAEAPPLAAIEIGSSTENGAIRTWIEPMEHTPGHLLRIDVRYQEEVLGNDTAEFGCEIGPATPDQVGDTFEQCRVSLRVYDAANTIVHQTALEIPLLHEGINECRFMWRPSTVGEGNYRLRFDVWRSTESIAASRELTLRRLSKGMVQRLLKSSEDTLEAVHAIVAADSQGNAISRYHGARLAIASDSLAAAVRAMDSGDWRSAVGFAAYAFDVSEEIGARHGLADEPPALFETISLPDPSTIHVGNGCFLSGVRPILLVGGRLGAQAAVVELDRLRAWGLNLGLVTLDGSEIDRSILLKSESAGIGLIANLGLFEKSSTSEAEETSQQAADHTVLASERIKDQVSLEERIRQSLESLKGFKSVVAVNLATRPTFAFEGEDFRSGFVKYIRTSYPDRYRLNLAWKVRLPRFESIKIEPDNPLPIYQYDLQRYQQELGTKFFSWLHQTAVATHPEVPYSVGMADDVLAPDESKGGIDCEALSGIFEITGCTVGYAVPTGSWGKSLLEPSLIYTLLRSMSPEKPLANIGLHVAGSRQNALGPVKDYMRSLVWDAALSGVNAIAAAEWSPKGYTETATVDLLSLPGAAEGYALAGLDLIRLAPIVTAFQQTPSDIAILWSLSSKVFHSGEPFLPSVRRAFEGCAYAGRKIGFITESDCSNGELAAVKALVIPQMLTLPHETRVAVDKYIETGGLVIRTTTPMPYDARGESLHGAMTYTENTLLVRGGDSAHHYLIAVDAAYASGKLSETPRLLNGFGFPLEGIRSLSAEHDGATYLYAINLRGESVQCFANGAWSSGRDLITGNAVAFPLYLDPLKPMLIRIDASGDGRPLVTSAPKTRSKMRMPADARQSAPNPALKEIGAGRESTG